MNIKEYSEQLAKKTKKLKQKILENLHESENLIEIRDSIQKNLITSTDNESFSDLFAQTISYSMFAAKAIHDIILAERGENYPFKKIEHVIYYMPTSNLFLKEFFETLQVNSKYIHEDITNSISDVFKFVKENRLEINNHKRGSVFVHFYEDFLEYYNKDDKKNLGVWYTPETIVDYMIDVSNYFLIQKLNIKDGFLNKEYVEFNNKKYSRVQVLDPATGTGNFLVRIAEKSCQSIKNDISRFCYIRDHLFDKLNGFEIGMTSYTIANFNLDQVFRNNGYWIKKEEKRQRANIFLTNTLDKIEINSESLEHQGFKGLLAREASAANEIKENKPVFVVIGNPPYNGNSKNNSKFINNLMETYKPNFNVGPGLNDDYIKFFRYAHDLINKQDTGLISFITNNSFIKSQACQEMRISLLRDFDEIYILNLNGDKTKEDKNVFDIKTNTCISFLVKTGEKEKHAFGKVFYADLIGTKEFKFESLQSKSFDFQQLKLEAPNYFFIPLDNELLKVYNEGFSLGEIFKVKGCGILTQADKLLVNTKLNKLKKNIDEYMRGESNIEVGEFTKSRGVDLNGAYKIIPYRGFDNRFIYNSNLVSRPSPNLAKHESIQDNYYLNFTPSIITNHDCNHVIVTKNTPDLNFFTAKTQCHSAPLYIYNEQNKIEPNIKEEFIRKINNSVGDTEIKAKHITDYIYGYLNMPSYVETYNDLLKQNYPRVPYPKDYDEFYRIASIGSQLRQYHLFSFEMAQVETNIKFPCKINVNNKGEINVNNDTFFQLENNIWEFKIGACQVVKNWIKAREDEEITFEEYLHFLKIVNAIKETIQLRNKLNQKEN